MDAAMNLGRFAHRLEGLLLLLEVAPCAVSSNEIETAHTCRLMDRLAELEAPHAAAIESAIDALCSTGHWPMLADAPRYLLRLRIETSLNLLLQLCECGGHPESSLWDFPAGLSAPDLLCHLLLEWWPRHGRYNAARELVIASHDAGVR